MPSAHTTPATRVHGFVAREANVCVLLRRGPSKQVRMLRWSLDSDHIEGGQWLSGRVYVERCSLSPDGRLFLYFCGKFKASVDTFTAISRPPYFTALGFWPSQGTRGGGGLFLSDREVALGIRAPEQSGRAGFPRDFIVGDAFGLAPELRALATGSWRTVQEGVRHESSKAKLWLRYDPPWIHERDDPRGSGWVLQRLERGVRERNGPWRVREWRAVRGQRVVDLGRLDWADWAHDGSLLWSRDGVVFRGMPGQEPTQVADLRGMEFENMAPPDRARQWPW